MRDVHPLIDQQRDLLDNTMTHDASPRARARAHSLLLSAQGMTLNAITKLYPVDRDTVSTWIRKWAHEGPASLHDTPRSGSPPKLTPAEQTLAIESLKEEPRSLKQVVARCMDKTAKRLSMSSLKRLAKRARLRGKRVRKSLQSLRDPDALARGQREREALQQQEDKGKIALYYVDEAGCALDPSIPYAWQESGTVIELPAMQYGRINVGGFMHRKNDLPPSMLNQSIHPGVVLACFDAFCKTIKPKTVVMRDHASIHPSEDFEDRIPHWKKQGGIIKYLPTYSPELNLIEILWRRITYDWGPFSAYQCLNAMIEALENVLSHVGSKYQITFA